MGTTAEKFNYAFGTKNLLKTEINKINNVLDDNSTFRSYPQELFNGYLDVLNNGTDTLWSNLEKVSQTGTEAVLEGVETAPMKVELQGNTQQNGEPTPDTPIPVQVVKGENVVSVSGKNLFDKDNDVTLKMQATFTGTEDNELTTNTSNIRTLIITKVPSNSEITISINNDNYIQSRYFISQLKTPTIEAGKNEKWYTGNSTIVTTDKTNYLGIVLEIKNNGTTVYSTQEAIDEMKLQIEQGSTATPYVPYSHTDYPINLAPNMLPLNVEDWEQGGISSTTGENIENTARLRTKDYLPIEYLYTSIITANISNSNYALVNILWYGNSKNFLTAQSNATQIADKRNVTFLINTANAKYFRMVLKKADNVSTITPEEITTIQPSLQKDYQYTEPIELCKINTYKDFPFKAINGNEYYDSLTEEQKNALNYGSWYVHKEINKVVFDGSESWIERRNADNVKQFRGNKTIRYVGTSNQFCNYGRYNSIAYNFGRVGQFVIATDYIYLCVDDNAVLEDFKTTIATNNLIGYYSLTTPTETEITNTTLIEQLEAIYKAKSVKDKTYITQTNDDLPFVLDVEAIKEYSVE